MQLQHPLWGPFFARTPRSSPLKEARGTLTISSSRGKPGRITDLVLRGGHVWRKKDTCVRASQTDHYDGKNLHLKMGKKCLKDPPHINVEQGRMKRLRFTVRAGDEIRRPQKFDVTFLTHEL